MSWDGSPSGRDYGCDSSQRCRRRRGIRAVVTDLTEIRDAHRARATELIAEEPVQTQVVGCRR